MRQQQNLNEKLKLVDGAGILEMKLPCKQSMQTMVS